MHTIFAELSFSWVYHVWVNVPLLSQICLFVSLVLILRYVFTVVAIPWGTLLVCVLIFPCCQLTFAFAVSRFTSALSVWIPS